MRTIFGLPTPDTYTYHAAQASVTLHQAQVALDAKDANGLLDWYVDSEGKRLLPPPSKADIDAYTDLFDGTKLLTKSLVAFRSNAKKGSIRVDVAANIESKFKGPSAPLSLPTRQKAPHVNPYLDVWRWLCHELEWAGPHEDTVRTKIGHHVLPVLYHHFGCVAPSHAALSLVAQLSKLRGKERIVVDLGSGTGYWTFLLQKQYGLRVVAVDSGDSEFRTTWIDDTFVYDGVQFLKDYEKLLPNLIQGPRVPSTAEDIVLLMVYPLAQGGFTESVLKAFKGVAIAVAGTINGNGFTGFPEGTTVEYWIAEHRPEYELNTRIPLPSFPGKDDGLQIWIRNDS